MNKKAGVVGAGLVGRLLALRLLHDGWQVTLFDKFGKNDRRSCGAIAAGMLALYSESEKMEQIVFDLGIKSLNLWPKILNSMLGNTSFKMLGSIVVAHRNDMSDLERMMMLIKRKSHVSNLEIIDENALKIFEPDLSFPYGLYIPGEAQIDSSQLFYNIMRTLEQYNVTWYEHVVVDKIIDEIVVIESGKEYRFDFVFDCRGIGAKSDLPNIRGVRGEVLLLYAPQVNLNRPIRMVHPRYSIYIVPRQNFQFVIGATEIESCDMSEVSVQSVLELLSAAYSVHKGFAEARIIDMSVNCRAAFSDNLPKIYVHNNLIRINGLYRHGYLLAPSLIEEVVLLLNGNLNTHSSIIEMVS
ncbi:FAD dependent oxidoreductase family protein [Ehrlichia chaffeensis str. Heartland]|uniref:FAD-dependent oxidoreductase n=1 Tax=Ehrlichia chaffeensis TaxID=945 RepID=UPI000053BF3E|nr:FAD-dependent oxidoreductase [Ehrlichia chaffeensis]AHX03551.1 FAD dependent oxidoreductase family protein [Ehrlichia chaffeensis str. Heartland]AHX05728.1 FAD dependent oxidoreductase family protein [Ehrlichia chaffeensis str. Jax]AHX06720.1 FAD dependent oxidoreductase family protein [Ehrlichia chaffeensis str. Liberty]AHX07095.1 FAD dependent oxidoreductase family protein [Ehrlichia chaffeensis str. Osceola]AHX08847.1 FAD dependent oxidoreductase family protein [Ehrlichia chaffeensis str